MTRLRQLAQHLRKDRFSQNTWSEADVRLKALFLLRLLSSQRLMRAFTTLLKALQNASLESAPRRFASSSYLASRRWSAV